MYVTSLPMLWLGDLESIASELLRRLVPGSKGARRNARLGDAVVGVSERGGVVGHSRRQDRVRFSVRLN